MLNNEVRNGGIVVSLINSIEVKDSHYPLQAVWMYAKKKIKRVRENRGKTVLTFAERVHVKQV